MRKSSSDILAGLGFLAVALAFGVQYEGLTGVSRVFPESLITFIALGTETAGQHRGDTDGIHP